MNLLSDIKNFEDFCEITFHKFLNRTKRIIYLQNCKLKEELKKNLKVADPFVESSIEVSFIKAWNSNTTTVLLTFNLQEQPYATHVPGQLLYTKKKSFISIHMSYKWQIIFVT